MAQYFYVQRMKEMKATIEVQEDQFLYVQSLSVSGPYVMVLNVSFLLYPGYHGLLHVAKCYNLSDGTPHTSQTHYVRL